MRHPILVLWIQYGATVLLAVVLVITFINFPNQIAIDAGGNGSNELRNINLTLFKNSPSSVTEITSDRAIYHSNNQSIIEFRGSITVKRDGLEIQPKGIFYDRIDKECRIIGLPILKDKRGHVENVTLKDKSNAIYFENFELTGALPMKNISSFGFIKSKKMTGGSSLINTMSYFTKDTIKKNGNNNELNHQKKKENTPFIIKCDQVKMNATVFYVRVYLTEVQFENKYVKIIASMGQLKNSPTRLTMKKNGYYVLNGVKHPFEQGFVDLEQGVFVIPNKVKFKIAK
jgi:hypothetical protein